MKKKKNIIPDEDTDDDVDDVSNDNAQNKNN